jgi:SAM-dependent methyltransferase
MTPLAVKLDLLDQEFLHICQNKSVLEIGPFDGEISKLILRHRPKHVFLLEAAEFASQQLRGMFVDKDVTVVHGDMHMDLVSIGTVDVVVALGVIYHSPAPLWLLERIVNVCQPKYLVIDNPGNWLNILDETPNIPGMRYLINNDRSCNMIMTIDENILVKAIANLDYALVKRSKYPDNSSSSNIPIYCFEHV